MGDRRARASASARPLAIAGVVVHVAGHGLAKSLGFYAALPLLRSDPDAAHRAPAGVLSASPPTAAAMGVSLGALAGLPPSPLFVSELLILLGGFAAGETAVAAVATVALALGFLGLLHALLEGVIGEPAQAAPPRAPPRRAGDRGHDRGAGRRACSRSPSSPCCCRARPSWTPSYGARCERRRRRDRALARRDRRPGCARRRAVRRRLGRGA